MLAACNLATAGNKICADCGPVRERTQIRRDFWIELPSAGGLAAPVQIPCIILKCNLYLCYNFSLVKLIAVNNITLHLSWAK